MDSEKKVELRMKAREKATKLVEQMTIDEAISQLSYNAPAIERLNIPEYNWWNEGLHGVARAGTATVFPQAIGLAAAWNKELMREIGEVIAVEARAKYNVAKKHGDRDIYKGLTLWTPNVNIFRDPRWGRGHETLGEDPYLTSALCIEEIKGLQGDEEYLKTAACAKHFAVHSGPESKRHYFNAKASKKDVVETYLPAFKAAVCEAGVEAVMGAYNRTNGEPCCANTELIENILRGEWGFQGHFVSDCWAIKDFHEHHDITKNGVESSALALNKGCDLNCGCSYLCLKEALNKRLVTKEAIKNAAIRLFTTRYLLGMFEETEYDSIPYAVLDCKEHKALNLRAAEESIVLLKNDGLLPLKKSDIKVLGVIGPNADSRKALEGNYHGTAARYVTALEGLQDYLKDEVRVMYSIGCELSELKSEMLSKYENDRVSEALAVAECSDVVVLCLGLDENLEGEEGDMSNVYFSGDKEDLLLPKSQRVLLDAVLSTGKPVIVCIFTGSAMDLNKASGANALLQTWYPGAEGGKALANILFGEVSPSAKLPITIYQSIEDLPDFEDYSMKNRTYRYMKKDALYPFGFGLNYGNTNIEKVEILQDDTSTLIEENKIITRDLQEIKLSVTISNTGMDTRDIIEVYVKNDSKFAPPNPVLVAFEKVTVPNGKRKVIELTIPIKAFKIVNDNGEFVFDSNNSSVYIGTFAPNKRSLELTGKSINSFTINWNKEA